MSTTPTLPTWMSRWVAYCNGWTARHLADNTIVVFTSDNGPVTSNWLSWYETNAYGSTGGYRGRKHLLYEGGIKVPAIIRYPGVVEPGSTSDELVVGTDLFVTLAHLGGGTVPDDRPIDGVDVRAVLSGGELGDRTVFWALDSVSELEFVVRKGDWKLLIDRDGNPRELYDSRIGSARVFQCPRRQCGRCRGPDVCIRGTALFAEAGVQ